MIWDILGFIGDIEGCIMAYAELRCICKVPSSIKTNVVDDMFLSTQMSTVQFGPNPEGTPNRINPADVRNHIVWSQQFQKTSDPESVYLIEIAFNSNDNMEYVANLSYNQVIACTQKTPPTEIKIPIPPPQNQE